MPKTPTHVRVQHKDGRVWDCPTRALPHWREKGWTPVEEAKRPAGKKAAAKKTTSRRRSAAKKTTAKKAASSNTSSKPAGD